MFIFKKDVTGYILRYKRRLVAKCYLQVVGMDFKETFAYVAKFTTITTIVAIGATINLEMHQMDVNIIFSIRELDEHIYIEQPQAFIQEGKHYLIYKLKNILCQLKQ